MNAEKIIFIVGPTATGKSNVAFCVARNIQGEIISCDSMQVYKEIQIASNKPSQEELSQIPHHLVNTISIQEEFDVALFNKYAIEAIQEIHNRDRVPIIVGGSGMYMQILLDGIFSGGVRNETLRKNLKEQAKHYGNEHLYDKLKEADPKAAEKIHPNDLRRVIRGLEICMTQKFPISEMQQKREGIWGKYDINLYALSWDRNELYERINKRVDDMFELGIVDEIKSIDEKLWGKTASKIIGVQEIQGYLRKEYSLDQAKEQMKLNTRHLAKRQLTWFRREKRLQWIVTTEQDSSEEIAQLITNGTQTDASGCL